MRFRIRVSTVLFVVCALGAVTGCGGGSGSSDSDSSSTSAAESTATTTESDPPEASPVDDLGVTVTLATAGRSGAVVQTVTAPGTRLQPADVITKVDGEPIETIADLSDAIAAHKELSESFEITVYRGTHHFTLNEVLSPTVYLGVEIRDPKKGESGLMVVSVTSDSPAEKAGIEKGDVIEAIDGSGLASGDDLVAAVAKHEAGDEVTLTLDRGSGTEDVRVTVADRPVPGG